MPLLQPRQTKAKILRDELAKIEETKKEKERIEKEKEKQKLTNSFKNFFQEFQASNQTSESNFTYTELEFIFKTLRGVRINSAICKEIHNATPESLFREFAAIQGKIQDILQNRTIKHSLQE